MKIAFLLGAGASSPFLYDSHSCLDTRRLTAELLNIHNWSDILNLYEKIRSTLKHKTSADNIGQGNIETLLNRITELLTKTEQFKNFNFEHVIHLLDRFSFYFSCDLGIREYGMIDVLPTVFWMDNDHDLKKQFYTDTGHQGWRYIPLLAREIIASVIIKLWGYSANKSNAIKLYKEYFDEIITHRDSINIYSQNYDPLLYTALEASKKFCTGFTNQYFDNKEFSQTANVMAFLHGHIGFVGRSFVDDYSKAQNDRLQATIQHAGAFRTGMKGVSYNTYLITGLDKFEAFSQNPFACYLQRFGKDINESDCFIIIGTSLQDDHLSSMLINYLVQKGGKVIYVTHMSGDQIRTCLLRDISDDENHLLFLMTFFEDNFVSYERPFDRGRVKHVHQLCESINKLGYGKFTDNVVLYANGSEDFFKKKQEIRILLQVLTD